MSVQIGLDEHAFEHARAEVVAIHHRLRDGLRSLSLSTESMLGGWRGVAAGQYAQAWAEWEHGAGSILDSLLALTQAMDLARAQLWASDAEAVGRAAYLQGRLEAR